MQMIYGDHDNQLSSIQLLFSVVEVSSNAATEHTDIHVCLWMYYSNSSKHLREELYSRRQLTMKNDDPTSPPPSWPGSPLLSSTLITFFDPHSHLELNGCHSLTFDDGDCQAEGTMHFRPGMTIMAGQHHGRDASLSSLESWLSEIGSQGVRYLDEPPQQQMSSVPPRRTRDRPPTELVLTRTVDHLQQQQHQLLHRQKEQETAESSEEGETAVASWMASPTILACSSPEIHALCSKSSFTASKSEILLPFKTEDHCGRTSSSSAVATEAQRKSLASVSSNTTTRIGSKSIPDEIVAPTEKCNEDTSSISSSCCSKEDGRPLHVTVGVSLSKKVGSNKSDTTISTSATTISVEQPLPQSSRPRQAILAALPCTSTAVRRPSLHRRISVNTLPPMDQVLQQQPPPPRHGLTRGGSLSQVAPTSTATPSSSRLYQHRRNTTHFSLPSATYLK